MSERIEVIEIDFTQAQEGAEETTQTLKQLREEVRELRKTLDNTTIGTEEFGDTLEELTKKQQELTNVTKSGNKAMEGSYNALVNEMALLKKEWRSTSDEAKRTALGEQINSINNKLKDMDASIGNHQRNVGNYQTRLKELKLELLQLEEGTEEYTKKLNEASAISQKMQDVNEFIKDGASDLGDHVANLSGTMAGFTGTIQIVQGTMQALGVENEAVTEAIAKLQGVMAITEGLKAIEGAVDPFKRLTKAVQESTLYTNLFSKAKKVETADINASTVAQTGYTTATTVATTATKAFRTALISTGIGAIIVGIGAAVALLIDNWDSLMDKIGFGSKSQEDYNNQLEKTKTLNEKIEESASRQVNLMKVKGASAEEVYEIQKKSYETQLKNLQLERKSLELDITKAKNRKFLGFTVVDTGAIKRAQEALTTVDEMIVDINYELELLNAEEASRIDKLTEDSNKKIQEAYKKRKELIQGYRKELAELVYNDYLDSIDNEFERERKSLFSDIQGEITSWKELYEDKLIIEEEYLQAEELLYKKYNKSIADINNKERIYNIEKQYDKELSLAELHLIKMNKIAQSLFDINKNERDFLENERESLITMRDNLLLLGEDVTDIEKAIQQNEQDLINNAKDRIQLEIDSIKELSFVLNDSISQIISIGDGLSSSWNSVFASISTGLDKVGSSLKNGEKDWMTYAKVASSAMSLASNLLISLAEEQDEASKEGFEQQKKYHIGAATMSMLGGIIDAWTSAMSPSNAWMTIWGQLAMGATMTALIATTGALQIDAIKKQTFNGGATDVPSVTPNISSINAITNPVQNTYLTGGSYEESIKDQRVYVLESDITSTQDNVRVIENESTY